MRRTSPRPLILAAVIALVGGLILFIAGRAAAPDVEATPTASPNAGTTTRPTGENTAAVFSESEIDALVAPYAATVDGVSDVHIDLIPGGGSLTAHYTALGITVDVTAGARLDVVDHALAIDVTDAAIAGIAPPGAAIDAVRDQLEQMITGALMDGLAAHAAPESITLDALEIDDAALTIHFWESAPASPTP